MRHLRREIALVEHPFAREIDEGAHLGRQVAARRPERGELALAHQVRGQHALLPGLGRDALLRAYGAVFASCCACWRPSPC